MSRVLCQCLNVTEAEIKRAIRAGARSVDDIGERCEAGTGCGSCRGGIGVLLSEHLLARARKPLPAALLDQLRLFGRGSDG
ncbi:MAG: (2Fe-2S)-binding protein [Nannocystaceae bacterium]|nr:(2Fe-2S)-binding protein [Nannocystaceae bacterium]